VNSIIAFSGKIGSGKSTLSKSIAKELDLPYISFGEYVRHMASIRALDCSRDTLQSLGEKLINEQGWWNFCTNVLYHGGWYASKAVVLDGIRHMEALECIKQIVYPLGVILVYIQLESSERALRIKKRDKTNELTLGRFDNHSTETQVSYIMMEAANILLDGNTSLESLQNQVLELLKNRT
jgi:dephospho-CoA kinase